MAVSEVLKLFKRVTGETHGPSPIKCLFLVVSLPPYTSEAWPRLLKLRVTLGSCYSQGHHPSGRSVAPEAKTPLPLGPVITPSRKSDSWS